MASLELRQVVKRFGAVEIIHGVDLRIETGEFVVFVGPSGCGKSTLLRMIAGLEEVIAGEVLIDGEIVNEMPAAKRGLAMVFQSYGAALPSWPLAPLSQWGAGEFVRPW